MITDFCREFGWTVEYVLQMPITRFFVMRKELFKKRREDRLRLLYDLTDVAAVPLAGAQYLNDLKSAYSSGIIGPPKVDPSKNPRLFDCSDKEQGKMAAAILSDAFKTKARLMGLPSV